MCCNVLRLSTCFNTFMCSFFRDVIGHMLVLGMWRYVTQRPVVRPHTNLSCFKVSVPMLVKLTGRLGCQRSVMLVVVPNLRFATSQAYEGLHV